MTPSNKGSDLDRRLLLLLFLVADFMLLAGLIGAAVVLAEGVQSWVPVSLVTILRPGISTSAFTLTLLLLTLPRWKNKWVLFVLLAFAFEHIATEAVRVFRVGAAGSYSALFVFASVYLLLHLGGSVVWLARSGNVPGPLFRPFLIFTVAMSWIVLLLLHWPLYS